MSPRSRPWIRTLATALLVTAGSLAIPTAHAARTAPAAQATAAIPPSDYQQVQLAVGAAKLGEAMSLAVLPDRSVVHTARNGTVRVTDASGTTKVAGTLNVYTHDEEGLQGVAADPGFATNRYIYLYYSPKLATPAGDAPKTGTEADFAAWKGHLNLSRFVLRTDGTLDLASEKVVLEVPNDRGQCCHVGGDIDFDAAGNLYLTTGDDTNPFESGSFTPIDERTDRNPQFDAQRSSGNTNDLRGKVLRIRPTAAGGYTVPSGNLFAPGTAGTRPEIYAMGFRNPFRMSVDKATGVVYLGDYGPDAGSGDANRGPGGQVEFTRITGPGNYGWPYCTGTNTPAETYNEFTFPDGPSGAKYDCAGGPANNSFRNTGLARLPAAKPSWIKYGDAGSPPEFGGGSESPMGGPVYRYDANLDSAVKFPASLNGRYFAGEYGRRWIKAIEVKADGSPGEIAAFPWTGTQVMDMAFGPDGALYVLDYGTGSDNQALYRVEHIGGTNRNPVAKVTADRTSGPNPLAVAFSSAGSSDPEGGALTYSWRFGDGGTSTQANPSHTYTANGTYTPTLTVTDPTGLTGTASVIVTVGNSAPSVSLASPGDGRPFAFGDTVPFQVNVSDPEDGAVDCAKVKVTYLLGHDSHRHAITSRNGCSGSIAVPVDGEHDAAANIYGVFDAEYTDAGGLTTHSVRVLQPRHRQAEHFGAQSGIQPADHTAAEGARTAGFIDNGDWISFQPYVLSGVRSASFRVSSAGAGGTIEVRAGSATGTLLGTAAVPVTGSWETFTDVTASISGAPAGSTTLFLVFKGPTGAGNLFDVDAFTLVTAAGTTAEAESYTSTSGVQIADHAPASGGRTAGYINNGDWTGYSTITTTGATAFSARISSAGPGGTIQIRSGSATGALLGTVTVPTTGGWETFQNVTTPLTASATGPLFLVYTGTGTGFLFDVDTFTLTR
ncbi:carbohydrate-binding protein [Streptosporangium roseum]|uniref:Glucose/sorbosone dehydrogenase-like protein n=1 Tax=Streptosporangium roseum (strain ATCC 12428 / DSM 43021 / JCM 3005 / KCTC 9067 / NCIMB 10171 / NRRL 2505 / NI 9100) TaxID=479432 RepID=D2ATI8_STRRD|nr:carbohydrate-binding protein [Streptosporangium roseum]ACZ86708.1 Glucose/sorbosone dehydrogenase-like protein [Streptosporangium roseum DSM 43021]